MIELIKVSTGLTGKMQGMTVITTSAADNEHCKKLASIKGSVCEHCYSKRSLSYRPNVRDCYKRNGEILSREIIPENQIPFINSTMCRLESHGDLINEIHLENYINIAKKNPHCTFALWTKQYPLITHYFKTHKQPENMIVVVSALMLNKPVDLKIYENFGMIVKSFTVYDKIEGSKVDINCGGRKCVECRRCYTKDGDKIISELLK